MSSDGHASDRSHSVVDESNVETGAEFITHKATNHRRQGGHVALRPPIVKEESASEEHDESDDVEMDQDGELEDGSLTESAVDERTTPKEEDVSDDEQPSSPDRAPPSHQIPAEDSEYSADEAESSDLSDDQAEVESRSRADDVKGRSKRTRKRKSSTTEAYDSPTEEITESRPLKKAKGPFNRAYLDLLNEDIEHAAAQYVPRGYDPNDNRIGMPTSQVGMTVWTSWEKERFFEALGRLGRDNAAGIARRIRTKGEIEVRQYMKLLQEGLAQRRQQNELDALELADFPAATELSIECCQALEGAADSLALRQEQAEKTVEWNKHGSDWLATQENCKDNDDGEPEGNASGSATLLNVPTCLRLSERLFINGPSQEANWQSVEGDLPSIRRTTLDDFYSLALTLTRRLVAASIFMATSRIRAERGYKPDKPNVLREKDVHAAALSLGMSTEKRSFFASAPRRLGLHVHEDSPNHGDEESREPMTYDDVEVALGAGGSKPLSRIRRAMERITLSPDQDSHFSDSPTEGSAGTDTEESDSGATSESGSEEDEEIKAEADEIIFYSAVGQPQTKRDRQALFRRIKAEREQERYADAVDAQTTYEEEGRMWALLGQPPPQPLVDPGAPPSGRRLKTSVDTAYSIGKDWRANTKVTSQWEYQYQLHG